MDHTKSCHMWDLSPQSHVCAAGKPPNSSVSSFFKINFIGILFTAKIHSPAILSVNFTELMRLPEIYQHHHHQGQALSIKFYLFFELLMKKLKEFVPLLLINLVMEVSV